MIERLDEATAKHLYLRRERGESLGENDNSWRAATRILGYLVTCAVSIHWLESHPLSANPYHEIPLERLAGIEIVSARLAEIPASLNLGGESRQSVQPIHQLVVNEDETRTLDTFIPESGWCVERTVAQIETVVFAFVLKERKVQLSETDRDDLNETLRLHRKDAEDPRNYHLAVECSNTSHPLRNPDICRGVKQRLPELPIIHFGPGADGQVPVLLDSVTEGKLIAKIRHFLSLIERKG